MGRSSSQSKSNGLQDLPASSMQPSSAVSANWKSLAKQLGLDLSRSRREKTTDGGKSKIESSKDNYSKFISSGTRREVMVEAPQPKRRKLDDAVAGKRVDGEPGRVHVQQREPTETNLITGRDTSAGRCVSLDREMVGTGPAGDFSMLARCSIVNHHGNVLYNSYVAPMDKITDYRTRNYSTTLKRSS